MYGWAIPGNYNGNVPQLFADKLGIDYEQMMTCANNPAQVDADLAFGDANDIGGTPAILVRYGDGDAQPIVLDGVTYDRGGSLTGAGAGDRDGKRRNPAGVDSRNDAGSNRRSEL